MDNIFLLLLLVSIVALIVGLLRPSTFTRFLKGKTTRKNIALIFGIATVVFFFLFGITANTNTPQEIQQNQVLQTEEAKFGLLEEQRKQVYKEIVAAEDRAHFEAEEIYPIDASNPLLWDGNTWLQNTFEENLQKKFEKMDELGTNYKEEVRTKYNLSEEQLKELSNEGLIEDWPLD